MVSVNTPRWMTPGVAFQPHKISFIQLVVWRRMYIAKVLMCRSESFKMCPTSSIFESV